MIELCKFWLLEFKEQRQYYLNGSFRFLLHKTNLATSPSLMNQIRTFKGDCAYYKDNKRIISAGDQMSEQFEDALYKITK